MLRILCIVGASGVTLKFGQDIDWPPYAYKNTTTGELAGFGKDIADGLTATCDDLTIEVVQVPWSDCWISANGGSLGAAVDNGTIDACMTYTSTWGVRQDLADFSYAILDDNKAAGLMTLLQDGVPKVNGLSDLSGLKIIDVGGWAPTADGLGYVKNKCTDQGYSSNYTLLVGEGNDAAMTMLRNGEGDAVFIYADQASRYQCASSDIEQAWNCNLWDGFGTDYAYVQTGQFGYAKNGTTLALAKKGSTVSAQINSCLSDFLQTKAYYDICVKHDLVDSCYVNSFFPSSAGMQMNYDKETDELTTECSTGYCKCPDSRTTMDGATGANMGWFSGLFALVAMLVHSWSWVCCMFALACMCQGRRIQHVGQSSRRIFLAADFVFWSLQF